MDVKWEFHCSEWVSLPAVSRGTLYFGAADGAEDAALLAVEPETGEVLWRQSLGMRFSTMRPVADTANIYFPGHDKRLYALHLETREIYWLFETLKGVINRPALVDGIL